MVRCKSGDISEIAGLLIFDSEINNGHPLSEADEHPMPSFPKLACILHSWACMCLVHRTHNKTLDAPLGNRDIYDLVRRISSIFFYL